MRCVGHVTLLLLTTAAFLQGYVQARPYDVSEYRLDYLRTGDGHEYNYHYNDGTLTGYDKRKFYKQPYKQPFSNNYFPSKVQHISTNDFPSDTFIQQDNLLPIFESHEKSTHYVRLPETSSKAAELKSLYQPSTPATLAERIVQMIQFQQHPSVNGTHYQVQYNPSGYQYFHAHPAPDAEVPELNRFPVAPSPTRAPYVAPILLKSSTPKPSLPRPPYRAPSVTTTKRPYVAPIVTSRTNDPLLNAVAIANQLKYTTGRTTASPPLASGVTAASTTVSSSRKNQPYEPEFDIDIRIDLRDDSV